MVKKTWACCRPNRGPRQLQSTNPDRTGSLQHPAGGISLPPDLAPGVTPLHRLGSLDRDSLIPACGNLGNIGFDSYRGPRVFFADAAIFKNFAITERVKAQFRMDAFNVFNHPVLGFSANQGGSGTCIDCAGNGRITDIEADASPGSTTGMRQIEFALKFSF